MTTRLQQSIAIRRPLAAALALALAMLALQVTSLAPKARALGPGTACVFYYPWVLDIAGVLGHTGWAFSVPGSRNWDYGSADGGFGPGGTDNNFDQPHSRGVWVSQGTFSLLQSDFASFGYTQYICQATASSAVGAAQNFAFQDRGFLTTSVGVGLFGGNCMDHAYDILRTYGANFSNDLNPLEALTPNNFYNALVNDGAWGADKQLNSWSIIANTNAVGYIHSDLEKGKFVSAELSYSGNEYGALRLRADSVGSWEQFMLVLQPDGTFALYSPANQRYVSAELGYGTSNPLYGMLRARSTTVGPWERFYVAFTSGPNGQTYFSLQSAANGLYVSAEEGYSGSLHGLLRARSNSIGPWEQFSS